MRILLASDGSEYSERAARFLTCFDLSPEDEITIFHSLSCLPFLHYTESYNNTIKEIKRDIAPRILDSALDILKPMRAKISTAIVEGVAEQSITEVASESAVDLIVIGARGIKGTKSLIIGSVTKSVAIRSPVPVLVIKEQTFKDSRKVKILFSADGSDECAEAGEFLCKVPLDGEAEITALNVIWSDFSDIPERFVMEINERIKDLMAEKRSEEFTESERILKNSRKSLSKKFGNVHVMTRIGDPSAEILRTADAIHADIIAVGCRRIRGMMGSVSKNILTHSKCSVLIGRACKE